MVKIVYKTMMQITLSTVLVIALIAAASVIAGDEKGQAEAKGDTRSYTNINGLEVARTKLKSAIESYENGDVDAARRDLDVAVEWLNKASQNINSEKAREESRQLAAKIATFKKQLKQSSKEEGNTLTRFLHQSAAIIGREIDHFIYSYVELSTSEKILKHLLDAKMHLYTAEHDLMISHDADDSVQELDAVLSYLGEADGIAKKPLQKKINDLSKKIHLLQEQVKHSHKAWRNNDKVILLNQVNDNLIKIKNKASPQIKKKIESIEADVQALQTDIERGNIKNNYESCMIMLMDIINEL